MYGKRIRELRESVGLNQGEFASALGIPNSTLSSYENERTEPNIDTIKRICSLYNVDAGWLLGFTDYHELVTEMYDDYADLINFGFSVDEAHRMTKQKFNRYGDMVMQLNYDNRKKVEKYCAELQAQQDEN